MRHQFAVEGVPRGPRAESRDVWQDKVREAATGSLPAGWQLLTEPLSVAIVYFHTADATGIDVDNMSKPILDALQGIIYEDDRQVEQLTARTTQLHDGLRVKDAAVIATHLERERDFVYIVIKGPPDHGDLP